MMEDLSLWWQAAIYTAEKTEDMTPVVEALRSGKPPLARYTIEWLANILDPAKNYHFHAALKPSKRGRPSNTIRNYNLYHACQSYRYKKGSDELTEVEWRGIGKDFKLY